MKFPLSWLKTWVDIQISADELAERLNLAGLEVEGIEYIGEKLEGIQTAKIEEIQPHPNADRLVITQVSDGKKKHQIVTGASNISVGDIVPVCYPGSVIAAGKAITQASLRGVDSFGMLCSKVELGVAEEADGIWILDPQTPVGIDFIAYASLKDAILDVAILPNRGDCQSIYGLARDIASILSVKLEEIDDKIQQPLTQASIQLETQIPERCPLYTARKIEGLKIGPSPLWMSRRLELVGIRPINNLVDITNYVLLELGQPLHAFDAAHINDAVIQVRYAQAKEQLLTLDADAGDPLSRDLSDEDMVIALEQGPLALGGVMGGKDSEVTEETQTLILESAFFDPTTVRRTAARHDLRTESAIRFEKGVDIDLVKRASDRAARLYEEWAGATGISGLSESRSETHEIFKPREIPFDADQINHLLGSQIPKKRMSDILSKLGIQIKGAKASVPSWRRRDLSEWPCLAEEILRIEGIQSIEDQWPNGAPFIEKAPPLSQLKSKLSTFLIHQGFSESVTYPMVSKAEIEALGDSAESCYQIQNPLSVNESVLRPHLLASLLRVLRFNRQRQQPDLKIYEIANGFAKGKDGPIQTCFCAGLLVGPWIDHTYSVANQASNQVSMPLLKGLVERLGEVLGLKITLSSDHRPDYLHPKLSGQLMCQGTPIGVIGLLHPQQTQGLDGANEVGYFSVSLDAMAAMAQVTTVFSPISKYPSTSRDIALLVPKSLTYEEVESVLIKFKPKLAQSLVLFDRFESEKLGPDHVSLAFRLTYQQQSGTLSDDKVNRAHEKFCEFVTQKLPVQIR